MSPPLPTVTARQVARAAEKPGFRFDRQRGSHAVYIRSSDGQRIVIPMHKGRDIRARLLPSFISDMGITRDEFQGLL